MSCELKLFAKIVELDKIKTFFFDGKDTLYSFFYSRISCMIIVHKYITFHELFEFFLDQLVFEYCILKISLLTLLLKINFNVSIRKGKEDNWLSKCVVSLSPARDILLIAYWNKMVVLECKII